MNFDNKSIINLNDCVPNQDLLKLENIIDKSKKKFFLLNLVMLRKLAILMNQKKEKIL